MVLYYIGYVHIKLPIVQQYKAVGAYDRLMTPNLEIFFFNLWGDKKIGGITGREKNRFGGCRGCFFIKFNIEKSRIYHLFATWILKILCLFIYVNNMFVFSLSKQNT